MRCQISEQRKLLCLARIIIIVAGWWSRGGGCGCDGGYERGGGWRGVDSGGRNNRCWDRGGWGGRRGNASSRGRGWSGCSGRCRSYACGGCGRTGSGTSSAGLVQRWTRDHVGEFLVDGDQDSLVGWGVELLTEGSGWSGGTATADV